MKWHCFIGSGSKLPPAVRTFSDGMESDLILINYEGDYYISKVCYGEEGVQVTGNNWSGDKLDIPENDYERLGAMQWTKIEAPF